MKLLEWISGKGRRPTAKKLRWTGPKDKNDTTCDSDCHRDWLYGPCRHEPHDFRRGETVWIAPEFHERNMPPYGPYRIGELGRDGWWDLEYIGEDPQERKRGTTKARGNILTRKAPLGD